tara:strand:- start:408 stop:737 length:330 start_codon:yes stop_codon:yes gene_type:complete
METLINAGLILTYLMISIGAIVAVGFAVKKIIDNIQAAKKTLYAIGGLIVITGLSYLMASGNIEISYDKYGITSETSKNVGMGLYTFYILTCIAIGSVLYTELIKVFNK